MSSNNDKDARIEKMKAKKAAADAARAGSGGSNAGTANRTATAPLSRAKVNGTIISVPRTGERCKYFEMQVDSITDSKEAGRMLMPPMENDSMLVVAPLTDERGDYPYKYDSKYQKTSERKPLQLGEFGIATVKLIDAPDGPVDWAAPKCLYPGQKITLSCATASSLYKQGTCITGMYVSGEVLPSKALDFELPAKAFFNVANNSSLAARNMALSMGVGGLAGEWQGIAATDETKQFAITAMTNVRDALLKPDGAWMKAMNETVAVEGDAAWKKEVTELTVQLKAGAAFQAGGPGIKFNVPSYGPTMVMPIYALATSFGLDDGMPGADGSAAKMMADEQVDQLPFFEGVMCAPPKNAIFGTCYKKGSERASGGPWLKLSFNAYAMASEGNELVPLYGKFTPFVSLTSFPVHMGSKYLSNIQLFATAFLPYLNMVIAFEADRNNISTNSKADETWDCRVSTMDTYHGLIEYGVELDVDAALDHFKDKPIQMEDRDVAKAFTTQPKPLLAAGFTLLNENGDARSKDWLEAQATQMKSIAATNGRTDAKCTIKMFGINHVDMRTMLERGRHVFARLHRDAAALPTDAQGLRWKETYYARRLPLGRLTAGASSMQPMPNLLRQWLYRGILHDLDFVNAHPTIMLGLVKLLCPQTWQRDAPRLMSYVADRRGFLDRIVRWYGLPNRDFAKTAILVVVNNGALQFWRRRVKSPVSSLKPDLSELAELQREVLWLRGLVFTESVFAPHITPLKERIRQLRRNSGKTEEEIDRSAFAYVIGHLESMALDAACGVLRQHGFVPTSLIYDGCLTTHNPNGDLDAALRAAEAKAEAALGFSGLELKEKDMYTLRKFSLADASSLTAARQAALDAATGNDVDADVAGAEE